MTSCVAWRPSSITLAKMQVVEGRLPATKALSLAPALAAAVACVSASAPLQLAPQADPVVVQQAQQAQQVQQVEGGEGEDEEKEQEEEEHEEEQVESVEEEQLLAPLPGVFGKQQLASLPGELGERQLALLFGQPGEQQLAPLPVAEQAPTFGGTCCEPPECLPGRTFQTKPAPTHQTWGLFFLLEARGGSVQCLAGGALV